jgi:predicted transcriptional regulator
MKNKYDHRNYFYKINGKEYKKPQAIKIILDILGTTKKSMEEIAEEGKLSFDNVRTLINTLRDTNQVINTKERRNGKFLYKSIYDCLLTEFLTPKVEEIEKAFKVKGKTIKKVDDFKNKSFGYKPNNISFGSSHYDQLG